ncbi:hypothetical protein ACH35V_36565 [Actinomadura sp. 1N219]|uniref:hypothetical protein n=1 Tax=Actinomadura sp. 1N219 TaxID=3375152 RepID=UPI00378E6E4D
MTETVFVDEIVNIPGNVDLSTQGVAYCPFGYTVTGGGATMGLTNQGILSGSEPLQNQQAWSAWGRSSAATNMTVHAICMRETTG